LQYPDQEIEIIRIPDDVTKTPAIMLSDNIESRIRENIRTEIVSKFRNMFIMFIYLGLNMLIILNDLF